MTAREKKSTAIDQSERSPSRQPRPPTDNAPTNASHYRVNGVRRTVGRLAVIRRSSAAAGRRLRRGGARRARDPADHAARDAGYQTGRSAVVAPLYPLLHRRVVLGIGDDAERDASRLVAVVVVDAVAVYPLRRRSLRPVRLVRQYFDHLPRRAPIPVVEIVPVVRRPPDLQQIRELGLPLAGRPPIRRQSLELFRRPLQQRLAFRVRGLRSGRDYRATRRYQEFRQLKKKTTQDDGRARFAIRLSRA